MGERTGAVIIRNRNLSILTITSCMVDKAESEDFLLCIWKQMDTMNEWERLQQQTRKTLFIFRYTDMMRVGDGNGNQ